MLAPMLFVALLELALRLCGSGYPTGFFVWVAGDDAFVANERFAHRFAPPLTAPEPLPITLKADKPAGVFRIFVFGESAALGVPDPAFSFTRILEVMLREACPDGRFEVINTAMMGINSHAILRIARDCAPLEGDLFIVYMGNNDLCGYFGPMTVESGQALRSRWSIDWLLWGKSLRAGQRLQGWLTPESREKMDMAGFLAHQIPADDPRRAMTHEHFRANLNDICRIAEKAGAKVILSTVAVNLKDCAPFGSMHRAGLSAGQQCEWRSAYQKAIEAQQAGRMEEALGLYQQAERIDDRHAELHYRLAQCLRSLRRLDDARGHYQLACDLDTIPFRADSSLNGIVRRMAGELAGRQVRFVDAAELLSAQSADGIAGEELLHEHVHLNFDGNYALARTMLPAVLASLPASVQRPADVQPPSRQACADLLALTPVAEVRMAEPIAALLTKPPFVNQFDIAQRQQRMTQSLEQLRQRAGTYDRTVGLAMCEAALKRNPNDWMIHLAAADLLALGGDMDGAMPHMREVLRLTPGSRKAHNQFGQLLIQQKKLDEAEAHYQTMRRQWPAAATACKGLGDVALARGQVDEAVAHYREADKLNPDDAQAAQALTAALVSHKRYAEAEVEYRQALADQPAALARMLANLSMLQGRHDEAIGQLRSAAAAAPKDLALRQDLASALMSAGRSDEATAELRDLVRIDPDSPVALNLLGAIHLSKGDRDQAEKCFKDACAVRANAASFYNLGNVAMSRRDHTAALAHYRQAVALNSADASMRSNLGSVLLMRKEYDAAIEHLAAAVRLTPDHSNAQAMLAQCYLKTNRFKEAAPHFRRAIELNHREAPLLAGLAWVLATAPDATLRNGGEAVKLAEEACEKTLYKSPMMLGTLAAAYAEDGRYAQAIRVVSVAAQVAEHDRNHALAQELRRQLATYQANKPIRVASVGLTP